jgi:hypothetical protein
LKNGGFCTSVKNFPCVDFYLVYIIRIVLSKDNWSSSIWVVRLESKKHDNYDDNNNFFLMWNLCEEKYDANEKEIHGKEEEEGE